MVKADIRGYIDVVDFFREEEATDKKSALRTSEAENKCEVVTSHKLSALYDDDVLDKWSKGDKAYPVLERTGSRISTEEAEEVITRDFTTLLEEIRSSPDMRKKIEEILDEKISEITEDIKNGELPDMVSASNELLDAVEESGIKTETNCKRVGFRHPSNRWYLREEYQDF